MDWMAFEPARLVPLHVIGNVAGAGEADSLFEQNGGIFHFPFIQMCQFLQVMIRDVTG
jgi:hypothetical protein